MQSSDSGSHSSSNDASAIGSPGLPERVPWSVGDGVGVLVAFVISMLFFAALANALAPATKGAPELLGTAGASALTLGLAYTLVRDRAPHDSSVFSVLCAQPRPLTSTIVRAVPPLLVGIAAYFAVGWGQTTILRKIGISPETIPRQQAVEIMLQSRSAAVAGSVVAFAVLIAPVVEETVFRGVLYLPIRSRLGPAAAGLLVSIVFAGVHNYAWGFFEATGTLLAPVGVHALYNVAMVTVLWVQGGMG